MRNLDITVLKLVGLPRLLDLVGRHGDASSRYTPMAADLRTWFRIDGGKVLLDRIELDTDGAKSTMTGVVDIAHWPEQTYEIDSVHRPAAQRGIWWAPTTFTLSGEAHFKGRFHLFKGGRELAGDFRSEEAGLDWYRFPQLEGSLVWTPKPVRGHRRAVEASTAATRSSRTRCRRSARACPTAVRFDATYADVDLGAFTDAMEMKGLRLAGRATGHNLLEWRLGPLGRASAATAPSRPCRRRA